MRSGSILYPIAEIFGVSAFWRYIRERVKFEDRGYKTPCWVWCLHTSGSGYARGRVPGRERRNYFIHRETYEAFVGPIPDSLQLDHLCRVRTCVNPHHLEPVTNRVNALRGVGPTAINARKTHCPRGHEYTPENTRIRNSGWRACRACDAIRAQDQRRKRLRDGKGGGEGRWQAPELRHFNSPPSHVGRGVK